MNAVLPESRIQKTLSSIPVDHPVWVTPWTMMVDEDLQCWLSDVPGFLGQPGGTAEMRVELRKDGFHVWLPQNATYEPQDPALEAIPNGIVAMSGAMRTYTSDVFFHGVASLILDVGGHPMHFSSGHATPWGAPQIETEAKRWVSIMTRPHRGMPGDLGKRVVPGMLGTDSNGITGDKILRHDGWRYHMDDPFIGHRWIPDMVYQVRYPYQLNEETGQRIPICDRAQGDILWAGGLHDTAAVLDLDLPPTTGYHEVDPFMDRRIDHQRVNAALLDLATVVSVEVLEGSERAERASDHRPVRTTLLLPSATP